MIKHIIVSGLCYGNETADDMERREKRMADDNAKVDALYADWERQRNTPMRSMIALAKKRGLMKKHCAQSQ